MKNSNRKVIVIVGPTGSGKTGVAIDIAKEIGGEIISADSRTTYKGMDIGTAKPDMEERDGVVHFGFDLIEPGERFTVADWKEYAEKKIEEIFKQGKVPIIVGGTGLYVDSLIFDYKFTEDAKKSCSDRRKMDKKFILVGINWDKEILRERLRLRIKNMFNEQLFAETKKLAKKYGWKNQAMSSNVYQFAWKYLNKEMSLVEAEERAFYDDCHLAKRQMTWFRRNKNIEWLPLEKVKPYVLKCIQDE